MDKKNDAQTESESVFILVDGSNITPTAEKKLHQKYPHMTIYEATTDGLKLSDDKKEIAKLFDEKCQYIATKPKANFIPEKLLDRGVRIYSTWVSKDKKLHQMIYEGSGQIKYDLVTFNFEEWDYIQFFKFVGK